jgi:hypothetical protein
MLNCDASLLAQDDYGRNPLHDACWSAEPQFELVRLIIEKHPELLCVGDVRGHTPLNYVRRQHWGEWCNFLMENRALLQPICAQRCGQTTPDMPLLVAPDGISKTEEKESSKLHSQAVG